MESREYYENLIHQQELRLDTIRDDKAQIENSERILESDLKDTRADFDEHYPEKLYTCTTCKTTFKSRDDEPQCPNCGDDIF